MDNETMALLQQSDLQHDLAKYTEDMHKAQLRLEALEQEKQEVIRVGVRLEGAIAYIKSKISTEPNTPK